MRDGDNRGSRNDPGRAVTIVLALYPEVTWLQGENQQCYHESFLGKILTLFFLIINLGNQKLWAKSEEIYKGNLYGSQDFSTLRALFITRIRWSSHIWYVVPREAQLHACQLCPDHTLWGRLLSPLQRESQGMGRVYHTRTWDRYRESRCKVWPCKLLF